MTAVEAEVAPPGSVASATRSEIRNPKSAIAAWRHVLLLLLITLLGGALRFTRLEQPQIWFDEAATFSRVCGTYQQMLDVLQDAGFGPLHYHLYWWIKN